MTSLIVVGAIALFVLITVFKGYASCPRARSGSSNAWVATTAPSSRA